MTLWHVKKGNSVGRIMDFSEISFKLRCLQKDNGDWHWYVVGVIDWEFWTIFFSFLGNESFVFFPILKYKRGAQVQDSSHFYWETPTNRPKERKGREEEWDDQKGKKRR